MPSYRRFYNTSVFLDSFFCGYDNAKFSKNSEFFNICSLAHLIEALNVDKKTTEFSEQNETSLFNKLELICFSNSIL